MQNTAGKRRKWRKIRILGILQTLSQGQIYPPKRSAVGSIPITDARTWAKSGLTSLFTYRKAVKKDEPQLARPFVLFCLIFVFRFG